MNPDQLLEMVQDDNNRRQERRERIATAVLAGVAAVGEWTRAEAVRMAVAWADALIAELDKP